MIEEKDITVGTAWLRDVILGVTTFRKCPCCNSDGLTFECGEEKLSYAKPEWEEEFTSIDLCDNCDGVGYIENTRKE